MLDLELRKIITKHTIANDRKGIRMFNLLKLENTQGNEVISIEHIWPELRRKQYYNTLCDLKQELQILQEIPNLNNKLKIKAKRSLDKINIMIMKMNPELN